MTADEWTEQLTKWFPQPDHVIWRVVGDLRAKEQELAPRLAINHDLDMWD